MTTAWGPRKTLSHTMTHFPNSLLSCQSPDLQGLKLHSWVRETLGCWIQLRISHPYYVFSSSFNFSVAVCMGSSLKCEHFMHYTKCNGNKIFPGVPADSAHVSSLSFWLLALGIYSSSSLDLSTNFIYHTNRNCIFLKATKHSRLSGETLVYSNFALKTHSYSCVHEYWYVIWFYT